MNIFVDANIFIDIFDDSRKNYIHSLDTYKYISKYNHKLFTSCDLIATIYYINSKKIKDKHC